ncbi:MAG TPA: hypothetical protein VFS66_07070 [Acidimicrobiia bacterium]|nr:hypothetical protein [Acidimicrobiia bacterium]
MQTKEQARNWKVVASVATVAALGVSGLAVASPSNPSEAPPPIEIQDTRQAPGTTLQQSDRTGFEIVPSPTIDFNDSLDTPLASADLGVSDDQAGSPQDSPDPAPAPAAVDDSGDSPQDSPDPAPAPAAVDDSVDTPQDSPDPASSGDDSADSGDSLDS